MTIRMGILSCVVSIIVGLSVLGCTDVLAPPVAPSRLAITRPTVDKVVLTWQNNAPAATAMHVERADSATEAFAQVANLRPDSATWTDTGISFNGVYRYRIIAISAGGTGTSPEASVTITDLATEPGQPEMVVSNWDQTGWHRYWSDEFDGTGLDTTNWVHDIGIGPNGNGWGNNEKQYYQAENTSLVADGNRQVLRIQAREAATAGFSTTHTSSRITTKGLRSFQYGRIEACMKLPKGNGIWPAFWMLGSNIGTTPWPACGEIDIMEMVGGNSATLSDAKTYGTIHYADTTVASANHWKHTGGNTSLSGSVFADAYHLFGVEWTATSLKWYLDGILFHQENIGSADSAGQKDEFTKDFYILLNLAVCGDWPGFSTAGTVFPQNLYVDWVRVYKPD